MRLGRVRIMHDLLEGMMAEKLSHRSQIDAGHYQPACKRVAQIVPVKVLNSGFRKNLVPPMPWLLQWFPVLPDEDTSLPTRLVPEFPNCPPITAGLRSESTTALSSSGMACSGCPLQSGYSPRTNGPWQCQAARPTRFAESERPRRGAARHCERIPAPMRTLIATAFPFSCAGRNSHWHNASRA